MSVCIIIKMKFYFFINHIYYVFNIISILNLFYKKLYDKKILVATLNNSSVEDWIKLMIKKLIFQ